MIRCSWLRMAAAGGALSCSGEYATAPVTMAFDAPPDAHAFAHGPEEKKEPWNGSQ